MHVTFNVKHARRESGLQELLERERLRIERRLAGISLDAVALHIEVENNPHLRESYASVTLAMPSVSLNAHGVGSNLPAALKDAVDELLIELLRHRRRHRRDQRGRQAQRISDAADVEHLFDLVESNGDCEQAIRRTQRELHQFVRRELARHSMVFDDLASGQLEVAEIVEEAILLALSRRNVCPDDVPFDRFLITCAYDVLVREEEMLRIRAAEEPLQDDDGRAADAGSEFEGEDGAALDLPSSAAVADLLTRRGSRSPAAELDGRDLRLALLQAVRHLPDRPRKALTMVGLRGVPERDAAARLHWPLESVRVEMEAGRALIREELASRGFPVQ